MAVCDICNTPGTGTLVSAEQMREAVFANGFNPFELGLSLFSTRLCEIAILARGVAAADRLLRRAASDRTLPIE